MKYSSIPLAQTVMLHCMARGIKNVVISPGSRNAPLTISFTEHSYFECYSIVDERCAAFFAMGMAQQLKTPVALLCTSGSALLNYYPAIAEAYYSRIPLVVISADRPAYKIDIGDGQTIRQKNIFANHIGYSANLMQDTDHAYAEWKDLVSDSIPSQEAVQAYNDNELNSALDICMLEKLPIHLNVPFEEPLYNKIPHTVVNPDISPLKREASIKVDMGHFEESWQKHPRKLVLVGVLSPHFLNAEMVNFLGGDPSVVVLTETTSNLHHANFFPSIDSIVAPVEKQSDREIVFEKLGPDILITLGGMVVSKKVKAFLRKYKPKEHWHIGGHMAHDTFFAGVQHIKIPPSDFFGNLEKMPTVGKTSYFDRWKSHKERYKSARREYLDRIGFSDFKAYSILSKQLPRDSQLQLANSSTIRYMQLFDIDSSIQVFCNRGTSGIDGSVSTAIGAAVVSQRPTVLITGDLSFFYDSNALWNAHIPASFRIVLINNGGGG
ncbi:MAG: 2-succinyl-5-enolpyruvyl-6-hydroxy-3-cyclohexene-1-carboxylic-acid synthase, partial [Flavobacteriaceae bacterium]